MTLLKINKMSSFSFLLLVFAILIQPSLNYRKIEHPGPRYPPTKGEIWPKPRSEVKYDKQLTIDPKQFEFQNIGVDCPLLTETLDRYKTVLSRMYRIYQNGLLGKNQENQTLPLAQVKEVSTTRLAMKSLTVNLTSPCEIWPLYGMDEKYSLQINSPSLPENSQVLESKSIWGIMRGLESFVQLIHFDKEANDMIMNATAIEDFPRFTHRGLLLDTSRHFISIFNIRDILDGMAMNKLNVFHWHIVDDQSFPYESKTFPSLSEKGAYHPQLVYSPKDISALIEYARVRGIRVIPEFDTPGHTRSWGVAYPELLTECYGKDGKPNGDLGPIDPAKENVYSFMKDLLKEVVELFPEPYIHLGGDEVDFDCWESNPNITNYMMKNQIQTFEKLEEVYIQKIVDIVDGLNAKSIVWQEVFFNGVNLPEGTVVHAWTGDQKELLFNITEKGLPTLLSSCWYLDQLSNGGDWEKFYNCDPHDFSGTNAQKQLVIGGEACMWGEVIDDDNVLIRIFPRVSATAEKLWSSESVNDTAEARHRLEEHYCRMNKRGVRAQPPSGPGFCI